MAKQYYIVWNKTKTEGVVFDDLDDARYASDGVYNGGFTSTLADTFRDLSDDGELFELSPLDISS